MTDDEKIEAKIAAMEMLMIHGYISLSKYLEFLRSVKK
jgi:hypothetical protein